MKELTTKEIIRALPLAQDTKTKLISSYDAFDEDTKREVSGVCWKHFFAMKRQIEDRWREVIMNEIASGTRTTDIDPEEQVEIAVWDEIEARIEGKDDEQEELSKVRDQLEKFLEPR